MRTRIPDHAWDDPETADVIAMGILNGFLYAIGKGEIEKRAEAHRRGQLKGAETRRDWHFRAHEIDAELLAKSPGMMAKVRAERIAKKVGKSFRTVYREITSRAGKQKHTFSRQKTTR